MMLRNAVVLFTLLLVGSPALIAQSERQPVLTRAQAAEEEAEFKAAKAEPADIGRLATGEQATESVVPELASIVVLCATDPQSPEFEQSWSAYLREHRPQGNELNQLINQVLREAEAHRSRDARMTAGATDETWKKQSRMTMRAIAGRTFKHVQ